MKQRQLISLLEPHLNNNKIPKPIMPTATKTKKLTALPGSITKKAKSTSSKKSNEGTSKKARQKGKGTSIQKGN